jgi:hypothetical protein
MAHPLLHLALAASVLASAHPGHPEPYHGARGNLSVATPAVADAAIRVDGHLNDPAWQHAALLDSFTQYDPVEGVRASQQTQVLVLVDANAIYFGIRAYDDHPGRIRATMAQRDGIGHSDDYVRIILDTFHDQRRAYVFTVNPLGVQQDGIWNEGSGHHGDPIDHNPDFLWRSDGGIRSWGYEIEIRIPFKSLRFPAVKDQTWGLQVMRRIQRDGYSSSWAPLRSSISNKLAQMGSLTGLENLNPGLFLELNPVMTGKRTGAYDADLARYVQQDPRGSFGMNATYGLTSNLTLDATYNPDFSQVEADAGQISINERFALYYPEKRPFFLEGTEIFSMPKQLVYTRSIANPIGGVKLTGKVGAWNLGYVGARDEALSSDGYNATVNLLRVRRDVGASSTVGMVYTDRTVSGDRYNRLGGADARLVFAGRYVLTLLGAASRTADPDVGGTPADGTLYSARFERGGRGLSFSTEIEDSDHGFEAGSGFLRRTGDTHIQSSIDYSHYNGSGSLVESWGPSLEAQGYWDHDAFWGGLGPNEAEIQLGGRMSFRGNVNVYANLSRMSYDFAQAGYDELFVRTPSGDYQPFYPSQSPFRGLWGGSVHLSVSTFDKVRGDMRMGWSQVPIFGGSEAAVQRAGSLSGDVSLHLYPTRSFQSEVGARFSTIDRALDDSRYSTALIPRIRAQYQFSRAFFVRAIFEYSNQVRGALVDPSTGLALYSCSDGTCEEGAAWAGHGVHVEGLVSYEASPGTVFYVGYTRQMEDSGSFVFRHLQPQANGLFAKVSYRFRM